MVGTEIVLLLNPMGLNISANDDTSEFFSLIFYVCYS